LAAGGGGCEVGEGDCFGEMRIYFLG